MQDSELKARIVADMGLTGEAANRSLPELVVQHHRWVLNKQGLGVDNYSHLSANQYTNAADFQGWNTGDKTAAIELAIASVPADRGGTIFIPEDVTLSHTINVASVSIKLVGRGGSSQGTGYTWGATRIFAPPTGYCFSFDSGVATYGGPVIEDIQFIGNGTCDGGVQLLSKSNFLLQNVCFSNFTNGIGLNIDYNGHNSQYGTLLHVVFSTCKIGLQTNTSNGLRLFGCFFQNVTGVSGTPRVGSTAMKIQNGDTLRAFGTVIQFWETGIEITGGNDHELHGCRFEAFDTVAIKNNAADTAVYGGSFNNNIIGGATGTCIINTGSNLRWNPGQVLSVPTEITDTGTGTINGPKEVWAGKPNGTDDLTALQTLCDNMASAGGGIIYLRSGLYKISNTLFVGNKVILRGVNRSGTIIQATGGFAGTNLIKLGPSVGLCFGSRVERMSLDCNGIANSVGIYSGQGQEMCGASYVAINNFKSKGIYLDTAVANVDFDNIEVYPHSAGAPNGVYCDTIQGSNSFRRFTIGVSGLLTTAFNAHGGSYNLQSIHIENSTTGVLMDGANGVVQGVTGPTVTANVTDLITMTNTSRYVVILGATKNAATNVIKDQFFGKTLTDSYIQSMTMGDEYVARLNHYGDKLGFYGTPQISKPTVTGAKGGNAALTSLLTALANLGLLTDSST